MTDEPIKVTMSHVRAANMCSRGARLFFQQYKLDWQTFLKEGLPVEQIEATGDALGLKVAEVARNERKK